MAPAVVAPMPPTHVLYSIVVYRGKTLAQTVSTSRLAACGRAGSERAAHDMCRKQSKGAESHGRACKAARIPRLLDVLRASFMAQTQDHQMPAMGGMAPPRRP